MSEIEALVGDLVQARAARGNRKRMNRPSRRRRQRDLFDVVRFHLRRLSRRMLNDRVKAGDERPTEEILREALAEYVRRECPRLIYYQEPGEPRASSRVRISYLDEDRAVDAVARSAARYAIDTWDPGYIRMMSARGKRGGLESRRGPTWSAADLDALAALRGCTALQQAQALGLPLRRVERMRAALRASRSS